MCVSLGDRKRQGGLGRLAECIRGPLLGLLLVHLCAYLYHQGEPIPQPQQCSKHVMIPGPEVLNDSQRRGGRYRLSVAHTGEARMRLCQRHLQVSYGLQTHGHLHIVKVHAGAAEDVDLQLSRSAHARRYLRMVVLRRLSDDHRRSLRRGSCRSRVQLRWLLQVRVTYLQASDFSQRSLAYSFL